MGAKNVNSETCTVLNFKALLGGGYWGRRREMLSVMKARLQIDSIGSHSSWHVEYYLHISLWKLSRLCGGQGWSPPSCQCVELSLARRHIVSPLALCPLCFSCFRTIFPVSNLFISQDPRLSYLHDHCKCNVNESSDKIFLYFVISKEFLYRRTQ